MKEDKITIFIADNQQLTREGIRSFLSKNIDFKIVGEAVDGKELSSKIKQMKPDVVIIDFHLPGFFEIEDVHNIYKWSPNTKILIVTTNQNKQDIIKVLEYGVNNYIFKLCDKTEFMNALYATSRNEKFFCGKVLDAVLEKHYPKKKHCEPINLSQREIEIIQLLSQGLTNKGIADKLLLSSHTISTHRKNILKKLHLKSTTEMLMYALAEGIIELVQKKKS